MGRNGDRETHKRWEDMEIAGWREKRMDHFLTLCSMRYAEGMTMMEAAQEKVEAGHVTRVTGFEPEILAFCCEH